jgi:phage terminase large subunit-like protein
MYPPDDGVRWPTLGPQVCDFIQSYLCYGPGDLLGMPVVLNPEQQGWIYRMYEVYPQFVAGTKGGRSTKAPNPLAGKRRFQRCALSLRKGSAKTELAAWIAIAELHPDGPVRCDGFDAKGQMVGRGVNDPYIPMMAYTEEQTEELAYGALRRILEECDIGSDFDIGLERVLRKDGRGKCEALAGSPNAQDGRRTTHAHYDETHRWTLPGLRKAHKISMNNLAKRPMADGWALETTTAPEPGGGSVGEDTMDLALKLLEGAPAKAPRFFFYHREASDDHDLETSEGLRAAIIDASGPYIAKWTDPDAVAENFTGSVDDVAYAIRVWLNKRVQSTAKAFDVELWKTLVRSDYRVIEGSTITLGFDGSRFDDSTAIVATECKTGFQWVAGLWEKPDAQRDILVQSKDAPVAAWEVDGEEVDQCVGELFSRYHVARMYCDPPKWESWIAKWAGQHDDKVVVEWWTNRTKPMAHAIRAFIAAMKSGEIQHDGNRRLQQHIGNACRKMTNLRDEQDEPLWFLRKERPDSPHKIDAAMASILSYEACRDAIAAGDAAEPEYGVLILGGT